MSNPNERAQNFPDPDAYLYGWDDGIDACIEILENGITSPVSLGALWALEAIEALRSLKNK